MPTEQHCIDIENYVDSKSEDIKKYLRIVCGKELYYPLIHISLQNNIDKFIPRLPVRRLDNEDITIPRISVSDTILGACIGYDAVLRDIVINNLDYSITQGYYIYTFNYDYAIKPSKELVADTNDSNEYWLVNYNSDTSEYVPKQIGKFFISELKLLPIRNQKNNISITCLFEINTDKIKLSGNNILTQGYYQVDMVIPDQIKDYKSDKSLKINKLTEDEYKQLKFKRSSLESKDLPKYTQW